MKLLIFGAGGQVGTALLQTAWPPGTDVTGLTHSQADIRDAAAIAAALDTHSSDLVINAGGYTAVDKAESEPDAAMRANGEAPGLIAAECARRGAAMIHISTDYVFDGTKAAPYLESDKPAPLGVYGASKLAGERAVTAQLQRQVILRTSWVFSCSGTNFVKTMLRLAASGREIRVVQDQVGGPTAAADIAAAIARIAVRIGAGSTKWGLYHYCGEPAVSWYEFAKTIFDMRETMMGQRVAVVPIATREYPTAARRPANSRLDCGKIRADYGIEQPLWRPALESAIKSLV